MYLELITAGILVGQFVYHRWIEDKPRATQAKEFGVPLIEDGSSIPLIYGRVRVRPILVHAGTFYGGDNVSWGFNVYGMTPIASNPLGYCVDMLYVLGIPFASGDNGIHSIWANERKMFASGSVPPRELSELTGDGNRERPAFMLTPFLEGGGGCVEFLNGRVTQQLVNPVSPHASTTFAGDRLSSTGGGSGTTNPALIPGYRGYMCAFLFNGHPWESWEYPSSTHPSDVDGAPIGTGANHLPWTVGPAPQAPAYNFEVSSYPSPILLSSPTVGLEANPADVLFDLVTSKMAKCGLPTTTISVTTASSFMLAAQTLAAEGHGYSRVIDQTRDAQDIIDEILRQIDGVLSFDPRGGTWELKLIRPDFDPNTIPRLNPSNCSLENFAAGGWTAVVNKVRVLFTDRARDYREGSATAHNQANAVGQDGQTREIVLQYPGVCTQQLADLIAERELAARSRPLAKCRATVDRAFLRVTQGDAVAVTQPDYGISGMIFRVAAVNYGPIESNTVILDLIQDFFYVHRLAVPVGGSFGSFPTGAVQ